MSYLVGNLNLSNASRNKLGGKAYNLALLNDYNVPAWGVLTTDSFADFLRENGITTKLNELLSQVELSNAEVIASEIANLFVSTKLPASTIEVLRQNTTGDKFYAVRSSAVDEDGYEHSFAGIMESYLYQKGIENLQAAILACYKSCFSSRALKYRLNKNLSLTDISCAVIIQEMIHSEKSGVLFTANPTNGKRSEFVISATFGLGEGVVSGECATDEYSFDIFREELNANIGEKDFYYTQDGPEGSTVKKELPISSKHIPTLSEMEIKELCKIAKKITLNKKFPQDIEWAIHDNQFYILQTRDITSLIPPQEGNTQQIVFDNSNIQESFCGVTTPLTFSYANEAYFRVYHQMLSIMGLKEKTIKQHEKRHWNMISFIKGRIYYNINSWYEGLLLFPSFESNKDSMEKMMGLEDPVDFILDKKLTWGEKFNLLPTVIRCYGNLIKYFISIDAIVDKFTQDFDREYKKFDRKLFPFINLDELFHYTDQIINNITAKWQAPIINDFYVMTYHGKALRMLETLKIENPEIALSNLLSGEEGIQSTEPTKKMLEIADKIKEHPELKEKFIEAENPAELALILENEYEHLHHMIDDYIFFYGDRVIGELKLESISLREDPSFIYLCLKNYLAQDMSLSHYVDNEKKQRLKAEKEVFDQIKKQHGGGKLRKFQSILAKTRKGVKYRENMRLLRTRTFGLSRDIYLEMGRQFQTYGVLNNYRDIFYLTLDELERFRMGRSVQTNFKELVAIRKKEFETYEQDPPANHFHTQGPVYLGNNFKYPYHKETSSDLKGLGCYPGVVSGEVATIFHPHEISDLNDKILCTLRTDPGWAPVFPMIKGLIVERGSMLSHSAVIARELGIPTIVNVPGITEKLKTGDWVEIDGAAGTINRVN